MSKEMKKCLRCGKCCQETIIDDVLQLDLTREPRLIAITEELKDAPGRFYLKTPCPFLCPAPVLCEIYPTRPSICVIHVPGTNQCCPQYDPDDQGYLDRFTDE